jgi:hypothetical protein
MILGIDANFSISDKITINSSLGYGIDGKIKCTNDEDDDEPGDTDIITAKINFNFAATNDLDVSFGYRYTLYDFYDIKWETSGFTFGLAYKFGQTPKISVKNTSSNQPGTKALVLKNDFHYTEYTLTVDHAGKVKVGDVIQLTADQVKAIKDALCGPYVAPADGELGIRQTWHKLGNKEVKVKELVMYDRNGQIVGASLTVTEVR